MDSNYRMKLHQTIIISQASLIQKFKKKIKEIKILISAVSFGVEKHFEYKGCCGCKWMETTSLNHISADCCNRVQWNDYFKISTSKFAL